MYFSTMSMTRPRWQKFFILTWDELKTVFISVSIQCQYKECDVDTQHMKWACQQGLGWGHCVMDVYAVLHIKVSVNQPLMTAIHSLGLIYTHAQGVSLLTPQDTGSIHITIHRISALENGWIDFWIRHHFTTFHFCTM